jgi:succinyl-CoA synthetase beta subunit
MRLKEYQGKELFKKYDIDIPEGKIITSIEPNPDRIAKAQVLSGKRGKNGLIAAATEENLKRIFQHCKEILIEEKLEIEKEYYLSLTIDKNEKQIVILFSREGGIEVEDAKQMKKLPYERRGELPKEFIPILEKMHKLMKDCNATLVEINPLVLAKNKLMAADSKIILDDNVKQEFEKNLTELEREAGKHGLSYVELEGNIAIIGNGAGLVMATLDVVGYFGGKVANFLDLGGGASVEKMEKAMEIILKKNPKVIFINIFGGITKCDDIANGLINYKDRKPIIIRMIGTNEEQAKKILKENNIMTYESMEECAKKAVENANK